MDPREGQRPEAIPINAALLSKYDLSYTEWETFRDFEKEQSEFHDWLKGGRRLSDVEARGASCRCHDDFVEFWAKEAELMQVKFDQNHQRGVRKWTRKAQTFAQGASSFMQDIKPLLDVVSALGPPYSGLAVGTTTALITLAARKNAFETRAWAAINGINDRLPGFRMYQDIYRGSDMMKKDLRKKIIFAYMAFIKLSMEICRYLCRSGLSRLSISMFRSEKLQNMTDTINDRILGVRMRCEELQSLGIEELKRSNKDLEAEIKDLKTNAASRWWAELQDLLGLKGWTPKKHQENLQHYLLHFNDERARESIYEQMASGRVNRFRCEDDFVQWDCPGESSFLILVGKNNRAIAEGKKHCWVSPFAHDLGGRLSAPYALYVFPPPNRHTSIYTAFPAILIQLLAFLKNKLVGNKRSESLLTAIRSYNEIQAPRGDDEDSHSSRKIEALTAVTTHVLQMFMPSETVYFILDRVDQCLPRDQYDLVRVLVDALGQADCVVKILMVADHVGWEVNTGFIKLPNLTKPKTVVMKQDYLKKMSMW